MAKNILISEKQARKLKKAIAAQDQVGGKVNAGIMDAVCGAAMCESSNSNNIETWYRGYNGKYGINGENSNVLWLTTDASYAKSYGNRVKEYKLDMSKCNIGSVFDIDDLCGYDFDYYDGPDDELINTALENGIDGYCFEANYDNSECICLWSNKPIISERDLTKEEYDAIDEYDNFDYQPYMELNESVDWCDIYGEHSVEDLLNEFERDKKRGITQKQWRLIPAEQYHTLLKRYMENPQMAKIPYNIVYDWFNNIIIPNAVDIEYITQLAGHSQWGPWEEVADYFGEDIGDFEDCSDYLEEIGFYDWCLFPDGSSAWSDYGLEPLFKIINEFQDNSTAEDILILINRCLDIAHCRGDLSSAFIEGGKHSCDKISNGLNETAPDYEIAFEGDNNTYAHLTNRKTLNESVEWNEAFNYKPYIISITEFLMDEGMKITPLPVVRLHREEQEGLYIKTGYYDPEHREINLFVKDRHPKDVLRSFVHEMIHHNQNITGVIASNGYKGNTLEGDTELEKLEEDAYLRGNIYFRRWTETLHPDFKSKDVQNLIAEDTIDLSSFIPHTELNPHFWKDDKLDSRIRLKLLDIADDFIEFLGVDWVEPVDIIMTGSLANYNWNKDYSDVDLHVVMNFEDVDENVEFVKDYFDAKKKLWNDEHEDLTIYDYPVEVYVQDASEEHASSGVYSLEKDKWLVKPDVNNFSMDDFDNEAVKDRAEMYTELVDKLCDAYKNDLLDATEIYDYAVRLFKLIKNERKKGFKNSKSEYNEGNITFKTLRRNGTIGKVAKLKLLAYNKAHTLKEN